MNLVDGASIGLILAAIAGVTGILLVLEAVFNYINKNKNTDNFNNIEIITK